MTALLLVTASVLLLAAIATPVVVRGRRARLGRAMGRPLVVRMTTDSRRARVGGHPARHVPGGRQGFGIGRSRGGFGSWGSLGSSGASRSSSGSRSSGGSRFTGVTRSSGGRRRSSDLRGGASDDGGARRRHPVRLAVWWLGDLPRPGREARRRRDLEAAVPEVIDVLRATVTAGINPRRALQAAAEGAPAPLGPLLGQAIRAAELGSGAGRALADAARSERLDELVLAGEALDLAETTGAPPGLVLSGVAAAAADRVRARQARMAATAQARLSARVVAGMAPAFLGVLALTSPSDAAFLVREPLGWATLAAAATFETVGIIWSTRIVRGPVP
jgi:Type II secretion system (T2SS), protein F